MRVILFKGLRPFSRGGAARRLCGRDPRVDEHPAGARLCPHRRHARGHRALHRAAAARCVCGVRFVPPSGRGGRLGHGGHLLQLAVPHGGARQREVHGAGRHGGAADRRVSVAGADLQAGVSRRFPVAHGAGRVSHRRRVSGRHRDAGRHARCRGQLAPHAGAGVGDPAGPAAAQSSDAGAVRAGGGQHPARQALCPAIAAFAVRGGRDDRGERGVPFRRARHRGHRSGPRRTAVVRAARRDLERNPGAAAGRRFVLCDDHRAKCRDLARVRRALSRARRRGRGHPWAVGRECRRGAERDVRGQWQPDADRHGRSRGRAQPDRATGICGRRAAGAAVPDRPAAVPAALRAGRHRVHDRGRDDRRDGSARHPPRKPRASSIWPSSPRRPLSRSASSKASCWRSLCRCSGTCATVIARTR